VRDTTYRIIGTPNLNRLGSHEHAKRNVRFLSAHSGEGMCSQELSEKGKIASGVDTPLMAKLLAKIG